MAGSAATASNIAKSSMVIVPRTIRDHGFRQTEESLPIGAVRYRCEGPNDKSTGLYCDRMRQ
jgi:hypothetical protein